MNSPLSSSDLSRRLVLVLGLAGVLAAGGCRWLNRRPGPDVVAQVNATPILRSELDRLFTAQTAGSPQPIAPQQVERLKLSLLTQMIDRETMLQYAAHLGIAANEDEVKREVAAAKPGEGAPDDVRKEVVAKLVLAELLRREVTSRVNVTDAEITDFYNHNQAAFNVAEPQYHLQQIAVTNQAAPATNLAHDKAQDRAQAGKKAQMLLKRLAQGEDFGTLAQQFSEDPNTAASGGDLGLIPESALLNQTPQPLRQAVTALRPGEVSPILPTPNGFLILKLIAKEPAGQRAISDPQVQQSIRAALTTSRTELLKTAFIISVRNHAKVDNYLADEIVRTGGK